jgi:hypothetical protein
MPSGAAVSIVYLQKQAMMDLEVVVVEMGLLVAKHSVLLLLLRARSWSHHQSRSLVVVSGKTVKMYTQHHRRTSASALHAVAAGVASHKRQPAPVHQLPNAKLNQSCSTAKTTTTTTMFTSSYKCSTNRQTLQRRQIAPRPRQQVPRILRHRSKHQTLKHDYAIAKGRTAASALLLPVMPMYHHHHHHHHRHQMQVQVQMQMQRIANQEHRTQDPTAARRINMCPTQCASEMNERSCQPMSAICVVPYVQLLLLMIPARY